MLRWARGVVAGGLLFVLAGFGLGVQPMSVTRAHETFHCGSAIPTSWLMSGAVVGSARPQPVSVSERRNALRSRAACHGTIEADRALTWGAIGVGALAVLTGWTAVRERRSATSALSVAILPPW